MAVDSHGGSESKVVNVYRARTISETPACAGSLLKQIPRPVELGSRQKVQPSDCFL
jgi:hypothetical protein